MADFNEEFERITNTADTTSAFDPADIGQNKAMAILAYISWLVLIPLFLAKSSKFASYHANQGLVLAIIELICWIVLGILGGLPLLGWIFRLVNGLLGIVFLIFSILGIVNVVNGRAKELPLIGSIKLLS